MSPHRSGKRTPRSPRKLSPRKQPNNRKPSVTSNTEALLETEVVDPTTYPMFISLPLLSGRPLRRKGRRTARKTVSLSDGLKDQEVRCDPGQKDLSDRINSLCTPFRSDDFMREYESAVVGSDVSIDGCSPSGW